MEQEHILKQVGGFSLFEMNHMTAEARAWHVRRLQKMVEEQNNQLNKGSSQKPMPPGFN